MASSDLDYLDSLRAEMTAALARLHDAEEALAGARAEPSALPGERRAHELQYEISWELAFEAYRRVADEFTAAVARDR